MRVVWGKYLSPHWSSGLKVNQEEHRSQAIVTKLVTLFEAIGCVQTLYSTPPSPPSSEVGVCVCVCVRWLIYCKPHGCLLGVGLRLGDCYIFWPHSPAFWESEASDKVCDTIGQQNNWMSRADVVASGPRHHSRVARQEHRWRVFLIFFLEIPFPWGLQAQEALVIS